MQNEKVIYRYSDNDFVAYLIMNDYKMKSIDITKDKRHFNRIKAYVNIEGNKNDLIKLHNDYKNNLLTVNLIEFSKSFKYVNKIIKQEIKKYKSNN